MDQASQHVTSPASSDNTNPNNQSSGMKESNGPVSMLQTASSQDSVAGQQLGQQKTYLRRKMFNFLGIRNTAESIGMPKNCSEASKWSQDVPLRGAHHGDEPLTGSVDCKFSCFFPSVSGESSSSSEKVNEADSTVGGFSFTKDVPKHSPKVLDAQITADAPEGDRFNDRSRGGQKSESSSDLQASSSAAELVPPRECVSDCSRATLMPPKKLTSNSNLRVTDNQESTSKPESVQEKENSTDLQATDSAAEPVSPGEHEADFFKRRTLMPPRKLTSDFSWKDTEKQEHNSKPAADFKRQNPSDLQTLNSAAGPVHSGERESDSSKRRTLMPPRKLTFNSIWKDTDKPEIKSQPEGVKERESPADLQVSNSTAGVVCPGEREFDGSKRRTLMPPRKLISGSSWKEKEYDEPQGGLKRESPSDLQAINSALGPVSPGERESDSYKRRTLMPPRKLTETSWKNTEKQESNDKTEGGLKSESPSDLQVSNSAAGPESTGERESFGSRRRTLMPPRKLIDSNWKGIDNQDSNNKSTVMLKRERTSDLQDTNSAPGPVPPGEREFSSSKRRTLMPPRKLPSSVCDTENQESKGQDTSSKISTTQEMTDSENSESSDDAMDSSDQEDDSQGTGNDPEEEEDEEDEKDQSSQDKSESGETAQDEDYLLIDDKGIPYTISKTELVKGKKKEGKRDPRSVANLDKPLDPRKIHYCMVCFRMFLYLSDLERHSITHSEHKPFQCKDCGKSFKRSSHLVRHKHIHTGEKPFLCAICQKGFRESGELLRHQRVHTGEKPYQCELCHMRFTERNTLRRHINRKHVKERLYQQNTDCAWDNPCGEIPEENTE